MKAYHEQKLEHINVETDEAIKEKKEEYARQLDEIEALLSRKVEFAHQEADDVRQLSKEELEREVAVLKQKQEDEIARLIESRSVRPTTSHRIVQIATWPLTRCPLLPTSPRTPPLPPVCRSQNVQQRKARGDTEFVPGASANRGGLVSAEKSDRANASSGGATRASPVAIPFCADVHVTFLSSPCRWCVLCLCPQAAEDGEVRQVTACLDDGADIDVRGDNACTPLSLAALHGNRQVAAYLIPI